MQECSHVIVFAAWDRYTLERIDHIYDYTTDERGLPRGRFSSYTDKIKAIYLDQPAEENFAHAARQTYIALGLALAQAAELRVDTTPAEGFDNDMPVKANIVVFIPFKDFTCQALIIGLFVGITIFYSTFISVHRHIPINSLCPDSSYGAFGIRTISGIGILLVDMGLLI